MVFRQDLPHGALLPAHVLGVGRHQVGLRLGVALIHRLPGLGGDAGRQVRGELLPADGVVGHRGQVEVVHADVRPLTVHRGLGHDPGGPGLRQELQSQPGRKPVVVQHQQGPQVHPLAVELGP